MSQMKAKKRIANDITQIIMENLKNYQIDGDKPMIKHSQSSIFGYPGSRKKLHKNSNPRGKILNRGQPDIDKYNLSLRKSKIIVLYF
jgi:hypothetical protein